MKKFFSLIALFALCLGGMAADTENTMNEAYRIEAWGEPGQAGSSAELTLYMSNTNPVSIWNCTLVLPEGVTFESAVVVDGEGSRYPEEYDAQLTTTVSDDGIHFTCYGADGVALTGKEGAVAIVTVNIDAAVVPGDYTVTVKDILLIEASNDNPHQYKGQKDFTWTIEAPAPPAQGTIIFNTDGGSTIDSITQDVGSEVTAPEPPTKEGYSFAGWDPELPTTMPEGENTYTALWTINSWDVIYIVDGEEYSRETLEYGAAIVLIEEPTKEGYTFSGWSEAPETMPDEDVTVTGTFTINQYTISFDTNGAGVEIASITQDYDTEVSAPADPEWEGHTFRGWEPAVPERMPAENITCVAQWDLETYTVTVIGDGVTVDNMTPQYGATVNVTVEERDGYAVTLKVNDEPVELVDGKYVIEFVTGDITVEATYEAIVEFFTPTQQYTMFSCSRALDFTDSDVKAYIATGYNSAINYALLEEIQVVPAGTGVMLIAEVGQTYMIPYADETTESNAFVDYFVATIQGIALYPAGQDAATVDYIYNADSNGFIPVPAEGFQLPAQSAYLQLPASQVVADAIIRIGILDNADAITSVKLNAGNSAIFDLQGRRVSNATKGIYIVNGKKIAVK